ncbi:putative amino acid transporter [Phaeomoniella chlamydospora]|uniref:Putative amino acid transporter n=1 Tax=Phaeomoniella chlamydospora TaxID=158046 RepID=A0A0G2H562_PHACM|nr:putative amino acid transporter [Phaeomoniella chlamydospora]
MSKDESENPTAEAVSEATQARDNLPLLSASSEADLEHSTSLNILSLPSDTRPEQKRQSSLSKPTPNGKPRIPRTPNRVRFDLQDSDSDSDEVSPMTPEGRRKKTQRDPGWLEDEDYLASSSNGTIGTGFAGADAPLLPHGHGPRERMSMEDEGLKPEDYLENARPKSNMRAAFMNMANSIIGAGIIGQPYALKQAGLITGVLLLIGLTFVVDWTIRLIVINSKLSGTPSFQSTVEFCFGRPGLIAISLAQWAFAFGGMIAFCVIIGDTIPQVFAALFPKLKNMAFLWLLTDRRAIIVLFVLGISWPLSLYRDIAMLSKASTLALLSMVIIIITVITQGVSVPSDLKGPISESLSISNGMFQAVGVISFAFVCHHNTLLIYTSLRTPTLSRFSTVVHLSTFISLLFCLTMALTGFLTFGSLTKGNLLNNFPPTNIMVNIARFCFGLNMLTTLPLECFVCREVILNYFYPRKAHKITRHFFITTTMVFASVGVSLLTSDLGVVFELVGATSACALAYILPPACYIRLVGKETTTTKPSLKKLLPAYLTIIFGFAVMIVSVAMNLVDMFEKRE